MTADYAAMRARADAAAPPEGWTYLWFQRADEAGWAADAPGDWPDPAGLWREGPYGTGSPASFTIADAEFIAHARTDLPALLDMRDAVLALHRVITLRDRILDAELRSAVSAEPWCGTCHVRWPCATTLALGFPPTPDPEGTQPRSPAIYDEVRAERDRAHRMHGATSMESAPPEDPTGRRNRILVEEVGEVAREFNDAEHDGRSVDLGKLRKELIQVAAMAVAWADAIVLAPTPDPEPDVSDPTQREGVGLGASGRSEPQGET